MEAVNATGASSVFTSVLANSKYVNANIPPQLDYVIETISAAGPWTWLFTIIALCVAYDQSMFRLFVAHDGLARNRIPTNERLLPNSQLSSQQGLHRWSYIQDAFHWTFPAVHGPQV